MGSRSCGGIFLGDTMQFKTFVGLEGLTKLYNENHTTLRSN